MVPHLVLVVQTAPCRLSTLLPQDSILHHTHGSCSHIWPDVCTQSAHQVKLQPRLEASMQPHQATNISLLMLRSLDNVRFIL